MELLMFDDSFQLSQQYFTILQMLRIFKDWMDETEISFNRFFQTIDLGSSEWLETDSSAEVDPAGSRRRSEIFENNCSKVKAYGTRRISHLKTRVDRKTAEIESLRDGVSETPRKKTGE